MFDHYKSYRNGLSSIENYWKSLKYCRVDPWQLREKLREISGRTCTMKKWPKGNGVHFVPLVKSLAISDFMYSLVELLGFLGARSPKCCTPGVTWHYHSLGGCKMEQNLLFLHMQSNTSSYPAIYQILHLCREHCFGHVSIVADPTNM